MSRDATAENTPWIFGRTDLAVDLELSGEEQGILYDECQAYSYRFRRLHTPRRVAVIGDVHGCLPELLHLLSTLAIQPGGPVFPVFVGDLTDRGPPRGNGLVLDLVGRMAENGAALVVVGNHDAKLYRYLKAEQKKRDPHYKPTPQERTQKSIQVNHGMAGTLADFEDFEDLERSVTRLMEGPNTTYAAVVQAQGLGSDREAPVPRFLRSAPTLITHAGLSGGPLQEFEREYTALLTGQNDPGQPNELRWVPARAGQLRGKVQSRLLYGLTTGQMNKEGFPQRLHWAADYDHPLYQVHGHVARYDTAPQGPDMMHNGEPFTHAAWALQPVERGVVNVDTGGCFGGHLSAYVLPQGDLPGYAVSVKSGYAYAEPEHTTDLEAPDRAWARHREHNEG